MSPLQTTFTFFVITVITSGLGLPMGTKTDRWLEAMGLGDTSGVFVGPGPDQESSGDFPNILGGIQGSGDSMSDRTKDGFELTDILIAVDHKTDPESFMPSSSSSSYSSSFVEDSLSEYDGIDSKEDVHIEESAKDKNNDENDLVIGTTDITDNNLDNNMPFNPNAIPEIFKNGANAELGPDTEINKISTRSKVHPKPNELKPHPNMAGESEKSTVSGNGKAPPNVLKYTAVIGVVMVAVAVGMGALISAIGLGAVRLIKRARKPKVEEL